MSHPSHVPRGTSRASRSSRPVYRDRFGRFRRETGAELMLRWPLMIAADVLLPMVIWPRVRQ